MVKVSPTIIAELNLKIAKELSERFAQKKVWTPDEIQQVYEEVYAKYKEEIIEATKGKA